MLSDTDLGDTSAGVGVYTGPIGLNGWSVCRQNLGSTTKCCQVLIIVGRFRHPFGSVFGLLGRSRSSNRVPRALLVILAGLTADSRFGMKRCW